METEPAKRYATAGMLADDLAHWLRGEPVVARPRGRLNRAARWVRRRLRAITVCVVTALVIALGVQLAKLSREHEATVIRERDESERHVYYDLIASAQRAVGANEFRKADEFLTDCPTRLRNWEWHYLMRICRAWIDGGGQPIPGGKITRSKDWRPSFPVPLALQGDSGNSRVAILSQDLRFIAGLSGGLSVRIWDAADGRERCVLSGPEWKYGSRPASAENPKNSANAMAFSPDGSRIAFTVYDVNWVNDPCFLIVGNVESGKKIYEKEIPSMLGRCLTFSPDGGRIAVGGEDILHVFDAASGEEVRTVFYPHKDLKDMDPSEFRNQFYHMPNNLIRLTYDPTGGRLAGSKGSIKVWDLSSGAEVAELVSPSPGSTQFVCPCFGPDGSLLAAAQGLPNGSGKNRYAISVWDVKSGTEIACSRGHTDFVPCIAFSGDGSRIASASFDKTVRVWDAKTGHELLNLSGHADQVLAVAFSPDGHRLLSVSADRQVHTWDATPSPAP
jgi:WD40 repeat protein